MGQNREGEEKRRAEAGKEGEVRERRG